MPNVTRNLIFVRFLKRLDYYVSLNNPTFRNINNKVIFYDWKLNNLYFMQLKTYSLNDLERINDKRIIKIIFPILLEI